MVYKVYTAGLKGLYDIGDVVTVQRLGQEYTVYATRGYFNTTDALWDARLTNGRACPTFE